MCEIVVVVAMEVPVCILLRNSTNSKYHVHDRRFLFAICKQHNGYFLFLSHLLFFLMIDVPNIYALPNERNRQQLNQAHGDIKERT